MRHHRPHFRLGLSGLAGAAMATMLAGSHAQVLGPEGASPGILNYFLGVEVARHSDIRRFSESDEDADDIVISPFAVFAMNRQGRYFELDVAGNLEHRHYVQGTFDDRFRAELALDGLYRSDSDRFRWEASNHLRLAPVDPLGALNRRNEQQVNMLSTGPDWLIDLSPVDRVVLGARYGNYYEERGDDDSNRLGVGAAWFHAFSPAHRTSLSLDASTVRFHHTPFRGGDYDRADAQWQYLLRRPSGPAGENSIDLALGYTSVEFDDPTLTDVDTPTGRVRWAYAHNRTRLSVLARQEISDVGRELQQLSAIDELDTYTRLPLADSRDPFERARADVRFDQNFERWGAGVWAFKDELDYPNEPLDQEFEGYGARLTYRLSPLITLAARGVWTDRDFLDLDQQDETVRLRLSMDYQHTRHWHYGFELGWYDRQSTVPELTSDDLIVMATLTWTRSTERMDLFRATQ